MHGKILVVDDVRTERLIISRLLNHLGYDCEAAENGWVALAKLQDGSFDLMMLDLSMPEIDGLEVLRQLRENSTQPDLPVIVMSSTGTTNLATRCLELGAEDYLTKPIDAAFLRVRLKATLERHRLRRLQEHQLQQLQQLREELERGNQELKSANLQLENLAYADALTGLPNRRATLETLSHLWAVRERSGRPLSLMIADIDHFKRVNDVFGHGVGDHVLQKVGQKLQSLLRAGDVVGRYGGEEFLILCPDTDAVSARTVGERLRRGIEEADFTFQKFQERVTMSFGVAEAAGHTASKEELIEVADQALYLAKGEGRNRVAVFQPTEAGQPAAPYAAASRDETSPLTDPTRLRVLDETGLLDSANEEVFDRFTRLAARLVQAPVSLVSLVTDNRQFFKSQIGLAQPWAGRRQTPLSHSFCQHVVQSGQPFRVDAAREHPLVKDNPAISELGVEAYLGVPLEVDGWVMGSFCVIDGGRRQWTDTDLTTLKDLASGVMSEIELRLTVARQKRLGQAYQQAKEAAESANQAKSDFLASASHELRTPLNGIIGTCELLRGTVLNLQQLEYAQLLRVSADSLLELVNDVLDLAKIESGHFELRPGPFAARELVAQWLKPLALRASQEGLRLILDIEPSVPALLAADATRLRQIVLNLVGNALKFTTHGLILVRLSYLAPGRLRWQVKDTGCGIPQDKLNSIFEAFAQLETPRHAPGTGLGLAIVRRLVGFMGGEVHCESEVGSGTSFHFEVAVEELTAPALTLGECCAWLSDPEQRQALRHLLLGCGVENPRVTDDESELAGWLADSPALLLGVGQDALEVLQRVRQRSALPVAALCPPGWQPSPAWTAARLGGTASLPIAPTELVELLQRLSGTEPEPSGQIEAGTPLNLLVLEDNQVNQRVIRAMLERLGHRAQVTASGRAALEMIAAGADFDLALVDLEMPEMNGLEFTHRLRQTGSQLPIVALTARAFQEDRESCLTAGMNGYLAKPLTLTALNEVLAQVPALTR